MSIPPRPTSWINLYHSPLDNKLLTSSTLDFDEMLDDFEMSPYPGFSHFATLEITDFSVKQIDPGPAFEDREIRIKREIAEMQAEKEYFRRER